MKIYTTCTTFTPEKNQYPYITKDFTKNYFT